MGLAVLRLYDTRTRGVVDIAPLRGRELSLYCCGPALHRPAHLGDLRTFLLGDLIHRVAELDGLLVTMVQNVGDAADPADPADPAGSAEAADSAGAAEAGAAEAAQGRSGLDVARRNEVVFFRDLSLLGIRPAHAYPRTTESIALMVDLVARLIDLGHAYQGADGSVFFDARSFPGYGALSGHRLNTVRPGSRTEGAVDDATRFPADWALWERTAAGPVWDSPWGLGRPGRHVECSAVSMHHLGDAIDVQTGGIDQLYPHHEDERAQSDAAAGHEVVRHWVHGEPLLFAGRAVATSTGNAVLMSQVQARGHDPLAVRLAMLGTRYRSPADLSWAAVAAADGQLARWRYQVATWAEEPSRPMPAGVRDPLVRVLLDDLDTPRVLRDLRRLEADTAVAPGAKFETFAFIDRVLALDLVRQVGRPVDPAAPHAPTEPSHQ